MGMHAQPCKDSDGHSAEHHAGRQALLIASVRSLPELKSDVQVSECADFLIRLHAPCS